MQVFHGLAQAKGLSGAALCLGNFDGVHLGHQALFQTAKRLGVPAALTFEPHPGKVLSPHLAPKLITLLPRKLELIGAYGISSTLVQPFDQAYAKTLPRLFEEALFDRLGVRWAVVGSDFTYGAMRAGTVHTLSTAAQGRGANVEVVPGVGVEGVLASSSRIREYILEGRVSAARQLLGRYFDLDGTVVKGQGRGRQLGFPTANVDTQNELRPAPGVYAVRVCALPSVKSAWFLGAANIGVKPTFGASEVTIEVHLFDFDQDLYGMNLRVEFIDRLRAEQRFASAGELTVQIRRDIDAARAALARAAFTVP
ncbi:MAG: riboflavin biosynthesis protein RibF [Myxococcaceae bacterium]